MFKVSVWHTGGPLFIFSMVIFLTRSRFLLSFVLLYTVTWLLGSRLDLLGVSSRKLTWSDFHFWKTLVQLCGEWWGLWGRVRVETERPARGLRSSRWETYLGESNGEGEAELIGLIMAWGVRKGQWCFRLLRWETQRGANMEQTWVSGLW